MVTPTGGDCEHCLHRFIVLNLQSDIVQLKKYDHRHPCEPLVAIWKRMIARDTDA